MIHSIFFRLLSVGLPLLLAFGCGYLTQPAAVTRASTAQEILLGGQLYNQPETPKAQVAWGIPGKGEKSRYDELVKIYNQNIPNSDDSYTTRKIQFVTRAIPGVLDWQTTTIQVSMLIPTLQGNALSAKSETIKNPRISLNDGWSQLAHSEAQIQASWLPKIQTRYDMALKELIDAREAILLKAIERGEIGKQAGVEKLLALEESRRACLALAQTRTERLRENSLRKQQLYQELAKQAQVLALHQRALTDYYLNRTDPPNSLANLRGCYDDYAKAYDRLKERIEAAFKEGREESKNRRERLEKANSPLESLKAVAK